MAIKKTDYVVTLNKYFTEIDADNTSGRYIYLKDRDSMVMHVCSYDLFWENFLKHVANKNTEYSPWFYISWYDNSRLLNAELVNWNCRYKKTKLGIEYIAFKSEADYVWFLMKWG
jgi:hypothetical protein